MLDDWTKLQLTEGDLEHHFPEGTNVGVLNGTPSGGLVDVDIDSPEALAAAPVFLPATHLKFGRPSNRASHWAYIADPLVETAQFKDDKTMLVELRSTGTQTIWPGSVHPSGEPITFDADGEPTSIDGDALRLRVVLVAACALLARHWPVRNGSRHDIANAVAGLLLRGGLDEDTAATLVATAARIAADEEWSNRGDDVHATARALANGERATGGPTLADLLDRKVVAKLIDWLHLRQAQSGTASRTGSPRGPSQATRLVAIAAPAEFFHTAANEAYVSVPVAEHWETWPVKNQAFRRWLARRFYEHTGAAPGNQALQDAAALLEGRALYDGPEAAVFLRVARKDGALYLDLANDQWEMVEITAEGWRVTTDRGVRFRRPRGMLPLPRPVPGGSVELLHPFINSETEGDWRLIVAWLLAALRPVGPYPVLPLHGEHGAAKSTTARVLRACIDPNTAPLRSEPRSARDLMISANNGWVMAFDNLSRLQPWLSDAFCRLATGGGFSTRELYADADEVLFEAQRPIILTGIQELVARGDLLDRSLVTYLPAITDDERRTEHDFWREFELVRPAVLGALLNAVATAVRRLPTVEMSSLPRLADFATWVTAAEEGLGWAQGSFMEAYAGSQEVANDLALDASPLAGPVRLLALDGGFSGAAATLLEDLKKHAPPDSTKRRDWPQSPRGLSGALRRLAPNLRAVGIEVEFGKTHGSNSRRLISIRLKGAKGGSSSPPAEAIARAANADGSAAPNADVREPIDGSLKDEHTVIPRPDCIATTPTFRYVPGQGLLVEENGVLRSPTFEDALRSLDALGDDELARALAERLHLERDAGTAPLTTGARGS